jgi:mRNA interferase HigB
MRIIAKGTLRDYWIKNPKSEHALLEWYQIVNIQNWKSPNELKSTFKNASIINSKRVVFNIKGNDFRLVIEIEYDFQLIFILWIGTHSDYDKIDVSKIEYNG